jgi:hypothetical protein
VFESIKSIRPYFHSLREIEVNVSLDIKLPLTWKFDDVVKPYRTIKIKVQDKNEKFTLISVISNATQEGYDVVFACASEIITVNKEEEEKRRLFQERQKKLQEEYQFKVKELEERFKNEPLNKLKDLNLLNEDGQEITTGDGVVEQGDEEGQQGDNEPQESID